MYCCLEEAAEASALPFVAYHLLRIAYYLLPCTFTTYRLSLLAIAYHLSLLTNYPLASPTDAAAMAST